MQPVADETAPAAGPEGPSPPSPPPFHRVRRLLLLALVISSLFAIQLAVDFAERLDRARLNVRISAEVLATWTGDTLLSLHGLLAAAAALDADAPDAKGRAADPELLAVLAETGPMVADLALYGPDGRRLAAARNRLPARLDTPPADDTLLHGADGTPLLVRTLALGDGRLLVGALDTGRIAGFYAASLRRPESVVALTGPDRQVLIATSPTTAGDGLIGIAKPLDHTGFTLVLRASRAAHVAEWWWDKAALIAIFLGLAVALLYRIMAVHRQFRTAEAERTALAEARDQAQAANRAKSRFLAVMSHELRTPMSGMLGTIDLLRQGALNRDQSQYVALLDTSAHALLDVLNDILDFSKLEAGAIELEAADFRLAETVAAAVDLFRARCAQKGLALSLTIDTDVPAVVHGDPGRLRQILANLIGNAVKFTDCGSIAVTVSRHRAEGGTLRFSVQDSGVGMSSATRAALFEPFMQADASTSRRFGGTGLGLAICRRLVKAMGGDIGLTSALGNGTRFWFTVPLPAGEAAAVAPLPVPPPPAAPEPVAPGGFRPRLLVAEDNEINRFLIREQLARRGYDITFAANGWEAVEAWRKKGFDALLLDMRMPVMDGPRALAQMREDAVRPLPPVIALTADALAEDLDGYRRIGIDALHTKPIDWAALDRDLRRLLLQSPAQSPGAAETASTAAIDPGFDPRPLEELREIMGADQIRDLVASFRQTLAKEGARLHRAALEGDAAQLREAAHTIQGMTAQLGAEGIAAVTRSLRLDGAAALNPATLTARLDLYDRVVAETLAALDRVTGRDAA
ncbi:ATP-binding protein [Zavarzinia compransoris]|nr:ATP-binding protein [Zavarzinia compransoris]TDP48743.1 signal transduction histidine kinase [Zavarzinia compransoris]